MGEMGFYKPKTVGVAQLCHLLENSSKTDTTVMKRITELDRLLVQGHSITNTTLVLMFQPTLHILLLSAKCISSKGRVKLGLRSSLLSCWTFIARLASPFLPLLLSLIFFSLNSLCSLALVGSSWLIRP